MRGAALRPWILEESVFAAVGGWLLLGQTLTLREIAGCALMLAACMLAQLPEKRTAREGA